MTGRNGMFVWHELMTPDTDGAARFYARLLGWQRRDTHAPAMPYTLFETQDEAVAGMMELSPALITEGIPPNWTGYVAVEDVDAMAERFAKEGGAVLRSPQEIEGFGRFAIVADADGAVLAIVTLSGAMAEDRPRLNGDAPGHVGWNELVANDGEKAFAFYAGLFGWSREKDVDVGEMGTYRILSHRGRAIGGIMTKPPGMPMAYWGHYFTAAAIDAAVACVRENGGKLLHGPEQVPGGLWIANCLDPQGAYFALVAPVR